MGPWLSHHCLCSRGSPGCWDWAPPPGIAASLEEAGALALLAPAPEPRQHLKPNPFPGCAQHRRVLTLLIRSAAPGELEVDVFGRGVAGELFEASPT